LSEEARAASLSLALRSVAERVKVFLAEYGEKGELVLRAALERAKELDLEGRPRLGDFDAKGVKAKLAELGVKYNPNKLLRKLERDYAIIETSYKSSTQHWWVFYDREEVERALGPSKPSEEGEVEELLLRAQFNALRPEKLLKELEALSSKPFLAPADAEKLKSLLFGDLERAASLFEKMSRKRDRFERELALLDKLVKAAYAASKKLLS